MTANTNNIDIFNIGDSFIFKLFLHKNDHKKKKKTIANISQITVNVIHPNPCVLTP